jgi:hypothetical protein
MEEQFLMCVNEARRRIKIGTKLLTSGPCLIYGFDIPLDGLNLGSRKLRLPKILLSHKLYLKATAAFGRAVFDVC